MHTPTRSSVCYLFSSKNHSNQLKNGRVPSLTFLFQSCFLYKPQEEYRISVPGLPLRNWLMIRKNWMIQARQNSRLKPSLASAPCHVLKLASSCREFWRPDPNTTVSVVKPWALTQASRQAEFGKNKFSSYFGSSMLTTFHRASWGVSGVRPNGTRSRKVPRVLCPGENLRWFPIQNSKFLILLLEEILHHLDCIKACNNGKNYLSTG